MNILLDIKMNIFYDTNTISNFSGDFPVKAFMAVIEKCQDTGLYVGYVPVFPRAHSQGKSLDELNKNLKEAIEMLPEDGEPML